MPIVTVVTWVYHLFRYFKTMRKKLYWIKKGKIVIEYYTAFDNGV